MRITPAERSELVGPISSVLLLLVAVLVTSSIARADASASRSNSYPRTWSLPLPFERCEQHVESSFKPQAITRRASIPSVVS